MTDLFPRAKEIALTKIQSWLPGGFIDGGQWVVKNPTRADTNAGSFKINLKTGAWNDYADEDAVGHDGVSLYAYLNGCSNYDAAKEILTQFDPDYFPTPNDIKKSDTWYQLTRSHKNAPEMPLQSGETMRWPIEIKVGSVWRAVMIICRFVDKDGRKSDLPHTLWTDGKSFDWRRNALKGVKYPLYGLRALTERPNARVVLTEGQKCASIIQPVLGDDYACVAWYGGAGNSGLTDFDPLIGREVWYPFDADNAGRKAIKGILDEVHAAVHLVFPPDNVPKGWDLADAVRDGWTRDDIITLLDRVPHSGVPVVIDPLTVPENRPTRLNIPISQETKEYIYDSLYSVKNGKNGDIITLKNDWFFWVVENDAAFRNCIKYDYTTGTKATAYSSTEIFVANIEDRLYQMGIEANVVTQSTVDKIERKVLKLNCNFNRVADYMDCLVGQYPNETKSVLDEMLQVFKFDVSNENEIRFYYEIWNIFLIRMHAHINGTRRNPDTEEYYGLIENDIVPILVGKQGGGKTTFCQWLACNVGDLYIDLGAGLKNNFGGAETFKKVRGRLIAEIGEMKIMKSVSDIETIKAFFSAKTATIDIKYVEKQDDIPLTCSYIGTSNDPENLNDNSGNRRFFPISILDMDKPFMTSHPDIPYRLHAYYNKLTIGMNLSDMFAMTKPSAELEAFLDIKRTESRITSAGYEVCLSVIKKWKEENAINGGTLNHGELEKIAYNSGHPTRIMQNEFKRAIADTGFKQVKKMDDNIGRMVSVWQWMPGGSGVGADGYPIDAPF